MANPQPTLGLPQEIPGFIESLLRFLGSCSDYFSARLQLLGIETKDAAANWIRVLILVLAALLLLLFTYLFLVIAFVFLLQWLTGWDWGWITLGVGLLHLALATGCLLLAWTRLNTSSFAGTIAEFKKDKQWLTSKTLGPNANAN